MGTYFKPLRRKIGVIALVLAWPLAVAWARSVMIYDLIQINSGKFVREDLGSIHQHILWYRVYEDGVIAKQSWRSHPVSKTKTANFDEFLGDRWQFSWRWRGFGAGDLQVKKSQFGTSRFCIIPYWSIVIPLTLLSAWLLLSKPRQRMVEPIPETAT